MVARRVLSTLGAVLCLSVACGGDDDEMPEPLAVVPTGPPAGLTASEWGSSMFVSHGCIACHQVNGTRGVGPALDGIAGTERAIEGGVLVLVDEAYLRESVLLPRAKIALGYGPAMPAYEGRLSDIELDALVAYLEGL